MDRHLVLCRGGTVTGDLVAVAVMLAATVTARAGAKAYGRRVARRLAEERTDETELRAWSAAMRGA